MRTFLVTVTFLLAALALSTSVRAEPTALPDTPSREAVVTAMGAISAPIRACGAESGERGSVSIGMVFDSSGAVVEVMIPPEHAGTPLGACFERAARTVRLPPFGRPRFTVNFPFRY